jgi:exopolysaccharide production protein ExoQ
MVVQTQPRSGSFNSASLDFLERLLGILSIAFLAGCFDIGADYDLKYVSATPGWVYGGLRYILWAGTGSLVCLRWRTAISLLLRRGIIWLYMGVVLLSSLWSDEPDFSSAGLREVFLTMLVSLYLASRYRLPDLIRLLALSILISALVSTVVALGLPQLGQHTVVHAGAWKGIYGYKNVFGSTMVLGSLTFLLHPPTHPLYRWGGCIYCIVMILLSTSKTSLVVLVTLNLLVALAHSFRWQGKLSVMLGSLSILVTATVATVFLSSWQQWVMSLGKDPTLTGRTFLWSSAFDWLSVRPWLGYGYRAVWAPNSKYAIEAGSRLSATYVAPNIHNGFLDLALDVGLVGFCLFLVALIYLYGQSLRSAYASPLASDYWAFGYLNFFIFNNLTESLMSDGLYLVLFLVIALTLQRQPAPDRAPAPSMWDRPPPAAASLPSKIEDLPIPVADRR